MSDEARGVALVVAAVTSLQFGAGFAVTLFDELGPAGAAFLRLSLAAAPPADVREGIRRLGSVL